MNDDNTVLEIPYGLSEAEMVVLIATAGYKAPARYENAERTTRTERFGEANGISLETYEAAKDSLNAAGKYLNRSAITSRGEELVKSFMPGERTDTKLSAFAGRFLEGKAVINWATAKELPSQDAIRALGVATIDDVGSENVYIVKDGQPYYFKPGNTDPYRVGEHDFSNDTAYGETPTQAAPDKRDANDMRGMAYAIEKHGVVLTSGSVPTLIEQGEITDFAYYKKQADRYAGNLYVGGFNAIEDYDTSGLIMGMTWDELNARQQGQQYKPKVAKGKMPKDAILVYSGAPAPELDPQLEPEHESEAGVKPAVNYSVRTFYASDKARASATHGSQQTCYVEWRIDGKTRYASLVAADDYDKKEFGLGVFRTGKGELYHEVIVKIDPKGMKMYFVDNEHYRNTDEVKWEEPIKLSQFTVFNKELFEQAYIPLKPGIEAPKPTIADATPKEETAGIEVTMAMVKDALEELVNYYYKELMFMDDVRGEDAWKKRFASKMAEFEGNPASLAKFQKLAEELTKINDNNQYPLMDDRRILKLDELAIIVNKAEANDKAGSEVEAKPAETYKEYVITQDEDGYVRAEKGSHTILNVDSNEIIKVIDKHEDRYGVKETEFDPTSPEGYAKIMADPALQDQYQETLDAFFQDRILAVRSAMREQGWIGEIAELRRDEFSSGFVTKRTVTDHIVAVRFPIYKEGSESNYISTIIDELSKTPEQLAKEISMAAKAVVYETSGQDMPEQNPQHRLMRAIEISQQLPQFHVRTDLERDILRAETDAQRQGALDDLTSGKSLESAGIALGRDGRFHTVSRNGLVISHMEGSRPTANSIKKTLAGLLGQNTKDASPTKELVNAALAKTLSPKQGAALGRLAQIDLFETELVHE